MIDPEIEAVIGIIIDELKVQREDSEGIFFREEDWFVDGRLDIAALATRIVEKQKVLA